MVHEYPGTLRRVIDGDTVDIDIEIPPFDIHIYERVRLYGIDTEEMRSRNEDARKLAEAAKERVEGLLTESGEFTVQIHGRGKYGRLLANLVPMGMTRTVSDILLEEGLAKRYE